jgi:hypothetical protein
MSERREVSTVLWLHWCTIGGIVQVEMPETVAFPYSLEYSVMLGVFDLDLCLGKNCCTVVVAKLADGD